MRDRTLVSIEPRLPPALCGTSTYGWTLAQHWPEPRPEIVHLVVDGAEASRDALGSSDIHNIGMSPGRLCAELERYPGADVLLHYSSRGFHRYGCPVWLARAMARWRRGHPSARLLVFFHEVPQRLPFTTHHYFLEQINRRIIKAIANVADVVVTNTEEHAARLESITGRVNIPSFPVPSNIPTPGHIDPFLQRNVGDFAIFGLPFTQFLTVQYFATEMAAWRSAGLLEHLHLIGPVDENATAQTNELLRGILPAEAIIRHGALQPLEVSRVLAQVGFCLTQSRPVNFSKSGTFAAFAAHGCAVLAKIDPGYSDPPCSFLIRPEELMKPALLNLPEFEKRGRDLREWYLGTVDWPVLANKIRLLLP